MMASLAFSSISRALIARTRSAAETFDREAAALMFERSGVVELHSQPGANFRGFFFFLSCVAFDQSSFHAIVEVEFQYVLCRFGKGRGNLMHAVMR